MIEPPENWNSWLPWDVTLFLGGIVGAANRGRCAGRDRSRSRPLLVFGIANMDIEDAITVLARKTAEQEAEDQARSDINLRFRTSVARWTELAPERVARVATKDGTFITKLGTA